MYSRPTVNGFNFAETTDIISDVHIHLIKKSSGFCILNKFALLIIIEK